MKMIKIDPTVGTFGNCTTQWYCEYYCYNDVWSLVGANVSSGYYCLPTWNAPPQNGYAMCTSPLRMPDNSSPEFVEGEHFVEYEYRDGKFMVQNANCPVGYHAPADPIEFAKQFGKLRIYPARLDIGKADGGKDASHIA